jgi:DNA-binding transcriptional ArsR family regulator
VSQPIAQAQLGARWLQALGHPVRVRTLEQLLRERQVTPAGLADTLGVSIAMASYHVRRLRALGLVTLARRTASRGAVQHHYQLADPRATAEALWRIGAGPVATPREAPPAESPERADPRLHERRELLLRLAEELGVPLGDGAPRPPRAGFEPASLCLPDADDQQLRAS